MLVPEVEDRLLPLTVARRFVLSRYASTHQSLLLRSPKGEDFEDRVEILFRGVSAIKLAQDLPSLVVRRPDRDELAVVASDCGSHVMNRQGATVFMIEGGPSLGYVVALSMFMSTDRAHGSNRSPLLYDVDGGPVPTGPFLQFT